MTEYQRQIEDLRKVFFVAKPPKSKGTSVHKENIEASAQHLLRDRDIQMKQVQEHAEVSITQSLTLSETHCSRRGQMESSRG